MGLKNDINEFCFKLKLFRCGNLIKKRWIPPNTTNTEGAGKVTTEIA